MKLIGKITKKPRLVFLTISLGCLIAVTQFMHPPSPVDNTHLSLPSLNNAVGIDAKRMDENGVVISETAVMDEFNAISALQQTGVDNSDWSLIGPTDVAIDKWSGNKRNHSRIYSVFFHPTDPDTFWISAIKSGLWETNDGGQSYSSLTDHVFAEVYQMAQSPLALAKYFISTTEGIYRSVDYGNNWLRVTQTTKTSKSLVIKSDDANTIIAGFSDGIRTSIDGGDSWQQTLSGALVHDIKQHPTNSSIFYATTGSVGKFYKSTDAGATWSNITSPVFEAGTFSRVAVSPSSPDTVYFLVSSNQNGNDSFIGLYKSTDEGNTFTVRADSTVSPNPVGRTNGGMGQPNYNLGIVVDPQNEDNIWLLGIDVYKSTDGGQSYTYNMAAIAGHSTHIDQLSASFSPHNGQLYLCNDGGIYRKSLTNDVFTMISDGLPISEVTAAALSQQDPSIIAGGAMHTGLRRKDGTDWAVVGGGDLGNTIIDPVNDDIMYYPIATRLLRSLDAGITFGTINYDTDHQLGKKLYSPIALDKADQNVFYLGSEQVNRSTNVRVQDKTDVNFTPITNLSTAGSAYIIAMEQATADLDTFYAASGSLLYRTQNLSNNNPTWVQITKPSGTIASIVSHESEPGTVYVLAGSKLYKSTNYGNSWSDFSLGLPTSSGVSSVVVDNSSANEAMYVGTDLGVYYKDANLTEFEPYNNNLPLGRYEDLAIYYGPAGTPRSEQHIVAAINGRGFWQSPVQPLTAPDPGPDVGNPCVEGAIYTATSGTFDDGSGAAKYANNLDCQWLIQPSGASSITLNFSAFSTRKKDDVYVYDGSTASASLIGKYSGGKLPSNITSSNGAIFIKFISNNNGTKDGWALSYTSS